MTVLSVHLPVLIAGEVLFDHFPDGATVLGGAPLNVAWNLRGLGVESVLLSAVGDDREGKQVLETMSQWEMDTRGLQTNAHPTGRVSVSLNDGQPSYEIVQKVAFDFIESPDFDVSVDSFSLLGLGSLAYRSERSRRTITDLIRISELPRFVDVNIRDPFFDPDWLDVLIGGARWVKLSEEELTRLSGIACRSKTDVSTACQSLRQRYSIDTFFVTFGSQGAYAVEPDRIVHAPTPKLQRVVDTVGAGDAFAAATIAGLIRQQSIDSILGNAVRFAAKVCGINGATTNDKSFFECALD